MDFDSVHAGKLTTTQRVPPVDNSLITAFTEWLRGVEGISAPTAEYYATIVKRCGWPPSKRAHKKAWRKYVKFLAVKGLIDPIKKMAWLDALELGKYDPKKRTQRAIPEEGILELGRVLKELSLEQVFVMGLGGARLKHIVRTMEDYHPQERVEHPHGLIEPRLACLDGFCRYYLGIKEGRKRCDYVYFPKLNDLDPPQLTYNQIKDALHHRGVGFGILRKFAEQQLTQLAHQNNIPLDAVKLIMSRGLSVSGTHYLNTRDWADKLFEIYVKEVVKPLLREVGRLG